MQKSMLETVIGIVVIMVAVLFLYKTYSVTQVHYGSEGSYPVTAKFQSIDGLHIGGDIKIGGIRIGKVTDLELDPKTYQAVATFYLKKDVPLPLDSTASISSDGLFGEKYVSILPGADERILKDNSVMQFTQSSVNLENLLGKFMFNSEEKKNDPESAAEPALPVKSAAMNLQDSPDEQSKAQVVR